MYKIYKNRIYSVKVLFSSKSTPSYHGLHTESEVTAGATGDTW